MIIPEVVNSNLTKRNLINAFEKILINKDSRNEQLKNINLYLPHIESNQSPYDISAKKISTCYKSY